MAWCPLCGEHWLVRTGQRVLRTIMGTSSHDIVPVEDEPELACPRCVHP